MSANRFFFTLILFLSSSFCKAQVTGSDTVCAGYIYTYNANIPGATSYSWSVPANWYELVGQGSSQISVTCNVNAGQVCAEGFDSNGVSLGILCLTTNLGLPSGGGGWRLDPDGYYSICAGVTVGVTPTITFNGTSGGGCLNGCGGGFLHPNLIWAIYSGLNYRGEIGTMIGLGSGTYYAAHVDTTLGTDFPQAILISEGCGGMVTNSFSIGVLPIVAVVWQQNPDPVCIGDTVLLSGNGLSPCQWPSVSWDLMSDLIAVTSIYDPYQLLAIVTGPAPSVAYTSCFHEMNDLFDGTCSALCYYSVNVINCNISASFQTATTTICENTCINFTNTSVNATSYVWSFQGATPDTSVDANPLGICYSNAGNYDVMLIASNSSHVDTLFLQDYISVIASPHTAFTSFDTIFCPTHCIDFINASSNATSYQWNFQGGFPSLSTITNPQSICYDSSGYFEVSLISSNSGCSDTLTLLNYIRVMVSPHTGMQANPVSFCPGSCTDFTNFSTNATSWQWNFPGATIDTSTIENPSGICYNIPGQYGVQLISSNSDCNDTLVISNYITVYPQPPALAVLNVNDTLFTDQGFSSYQWYLNGNSIPGATNFYYLATLNGDYNVVATDSNDCEVEAAIFNVLTNVENIFSSNGLEIIPNPFTNKISFNPFHSSDERILISILNNVGEKLFEKQTKLKDQEIDLSFLAAGLYILSVQSECGIMLKKIVKM